jgi:hypothetical protein
VATPTTATIIPGALSVAANVYEPLLTLPAANVKFSGAQVTPKDIEIKYTSPTGVTPACNDTSWATIASTSTGTGGWLAYPGQPYAPTGTLKVCADFKTGGGNTYNATSAVTQNTNFSSATTVPPISITTGTTGPCNL